MKVIILWAFTIGVKKGDVQFLYSERFYIHWVGVSLCGN